MSMNVYCYFAVLFCSIIAAILLFIFRKKDAVFQPKIFPLLCLFGTTPGFLWITRGYWVTAFFQAGCLVFFVINPDYFLFIPAMIFYLFSIIPVFIFAKINTKVNPYLCVGLTLVSHCIYINLLFDPIG